MAKKIKKYKVGLDSETYAISLVEFPAIEEELIALEKQEPVKIQLSNEEKHLVYSAVLIPDKPIYRRNENGDEYYLEFSKESIEKMAYEFLKEYRQHEITVDHEELAPEVTVVETWLKSDLYKDKSVALGLNENLPIGTWFAAMKVNNVDIWERIKAGELKGFSVESMIRLEEFNKQNKDTMNNIVDDMNFWKKLKETIKEVFAKSDVDVETSEATKITPTAEELAAMSDLTTEEYKNEVDAVKEELEEETSPTVETPNEATETPSEPSKVDEPITTPSEENKPSEEPKEEPTDNVKHLEGLIGNLKSEIEALKNYNNELQDKVKDLEKQPSAKPVNVNGKPSNGDAYSAWRETLRQMIG